MTEHEKVVRGLECCRQINQTECFKCPYARGNGCTYALMGDVLALLKAQQPRVMTLEELDDLRGRGQAVYYEDRDVIAKCQDMFYLVVIGEYVYLKGETYVLPKRVDQYGKTWRCWTSRPTDAQREAVKWDG